MRKNICSSENAKSNIITMKCKSKKDKGFIIVCVILFILLVMCFSVLLSISADSKAASDKLFDNSLYEMSEKQYKAQVRDILEEYQLTRSGLTLLKIVDMEGSREYRLEIHDKYLAFMDDKDIAQMKERIAHLEIKPERGEVFMPVVVYTQD